MYHNELRQLGWPKNVIKEMGLENYGLPEDPAENINAFLRVVTPREFDIIVGHYAEFETYAAIGKRRGLSTERVRQLAVRGLRKFRLRVIKWYNPDSDKKRSPIHWDSEELNNIYGEEKP